MNTNIDPKIIEKATAWTKGDYDLETQNVVKRMMADNPKELVEAFYTELEFGTGGLRGIMGVGTNRVNKYTIGAATQGLANYLHQQFPDTPQISVAIAYDCRNNSPEFGALIADVFSANNILVYLFDDLRPTPELSFAIRQLKCQAGVVLTASHNPKEYNGYKVYWEDGGQLVAPHDKNVIQEVQKVTEPAQLKYQPNKSLIKFIGEELDAAYISALKTLSVNPENNQKQSDLKIVFTPIHGTAVKLVPRCLKAYGFNNIYNVPEQDITDGNFPTVVSPNPEEAEALTMALKKAKEVDAELVMATDPDADRVGVATKDASGNYLLLNGNQTASLLVYYMINASRDNGLLKGNEYIVKTIVTTRLLDAIAEKNNIPIFEVLTGFKYIAEIIKLKEGKGRFLVGGEESYGYLAGEYVRDKDAVLSCALIAEMTAWAKSQGLSLFGLLNRIYLEYGMYRESLISLTKKGMDGVKEIADMMNTFRNSPPAEISQIPVAQIIDYQLSESKSLVDGTSTPVHLPKSNVIQFVLADESVITVRPSGTEPKIKFYFGVKANLEKMEDAEILAKKLDEKIEGIISDMKLK